MYYIEPQNLYCDWKFQVEMGIWTTEYLYWFFTIYADTAGEKSMKIPNSCSILSSWKLFLNFRFSLSTFNRVYHGVYNKRRQTVQKLTVFNIFDPVIYRFWWSFNVTLDGNILFKRWANELIPNIYYGMNYGHENSTSNKQ